MILFCVPRQLKARQYHAAKERVVHFLSGKSCDEDSHFKYWVKLRGLRLMDYPSLGLKNLLCVPAKATVNQKLVYVVQRSLILPSLG